MKNLNKTTTIVSLILFMFLSACQKDDSITDDGFGKLTLKLTDAPFPIEFVKEANITINKIEVRKSGENDSISNLIISEVEQSFNLLDLSNGITTNLADFDIPVGSYDLVRLYVSASTIILNDSTEYDLTIPSSSQSGLKIFVNPDITIVEGETTELLLDFDVSKSFVVQGNPYTPAGIQGFHFKPVIRAINISEAGSISGYITDVSSLPVSDVYVSIMTADSTLTSTYSDTTGYYAIIGIPEGFYNIQAEKEDYETVTIEGIEITASANLEQNIEL